MRGMENAEKHRESWHSSGRMIAHWCQHRMGQGTMMSELLMGARCQKTERGTLVHRSPALLFSKKTPSFSSPRPEALTGTSRAAAGLVEGGWQVWKLSPADCTLAF